MADDSTGRLPARPGREPGDWIGIAGWPLPAVVLAGVNAALAVPMLTGLHLVRTAMMPSPWRICLLLPVPLLAGLAARRLTAGRLAPGWRALVLSPVLAAGLLTAVVALWCWNSPGLLPWWVSCLVLLLPCGYGCATCVTLLLRRGEGFWPWLRTLTLPVLGVGAGQAIATVGVTIAAQPGAASTLLGLITVAAGGQLLVLALHRGGRRLIAAGRGTAPLRPRARLSDLIDPG